MKAEVPVPIVSGSKEWFRQQKPTDTVAKKTTADLMHAAARTVLGDDAERARDYIAGGFTRGVTTQDALVNRIAPYVIALARNLGFGTGDQFAYLSSVIYINESRKDPTLQENLREKLELFGKEKQEPEGRERLEPEERTILTQLANVLRLDRNLRSNILERLRPKIKEDDGKIVTENVDSLFNVWEKIATETSGLDTQ